MNNFAFYSPTEFVFGKGTESQTAELVKKYKGTKVMIVYGGGSVVRSGLLDKVKKYLDEAGIAHVELGGIQPNPTDPKVYEGIELGRREGIDFLLPVGGGSVIDTAKAIALGIPYEHHETGRTEETECPYARIVAPYIRRDESGTDLYPPRLADSLRGDRHDGTHHGTLFHQYRRSGSARPYV